MQICRYFSPKTCKIFNIWSEIASISLTTSFSWLLLYTCKFVFLFYWFLFYDTVSWSLYYLFELLCVITPQPIKNLWQKQYSSVMTITGIRSYDNYFSNYRISERQNCSNCYKFKLNTLWFFRSSVDPIKYHFTKGSKPVYRYHRYNSSDIPIPKISHADHH